MRELNFSWFLQVAGLILILGLKNSTPNVEYSTDQRSAGIS